MSKLIRRTKKNFGAALLIALQLITLTLAGLLMPWGPQQHQSAQAPVGSQTSAPVAGGADAGIQSAQAQPSTAQPLTPTDKAALRKSAVFAKKLYEPLASQVFSLATSRAESARQSAQQSSQESESPNEGPTLTTDREDYPPFSYVYFHGTGFQPGETVDMIVVETDPIQQSFEPWQVVADENGEFDTSWYISSEEFNGAAFMATATGESSQLTASATFTDANGDGSMTVSPGSAISGSTGNSFTFSFRNVAQTFGASSTATVVVPAVWTAPQTSSSGSPGFVSATAVGAGSTVGTLSVSGTGPWTVTIPFTTTTASGTGFDLSYGGGGTQVTAPTTGVYTFTTGNKNGAGTTTAIFSSPSIVVSSTIQERGSPTTASVSTGTSLTINKPSGVAPGDLMIANFAINNTTSSAPTPPSGWTQIATTTSNGQGSGPSVRAALLYKVAGASEPANYAFTWTTSNAAQGAIVAFSGVDTVSGPFDVAPGTYTIGDGGGGAKDPTGVTAITNATANAAIVMFASSPGAVATGLFTTATAPGALSELYGDIADSNANGGAGWGIKTSAGSTTGAGSATRNPSGGNRAWAAILLALKPITCTAPSVTTNPSNVTKTYGDASATFTAAASGTPAPTVQWQVSTNGGGSFSNLSNGGNISGATSGTLVISTPTVAMSANQYRAVFTNTCTPATATSSAATLTVNKANATALVTPYTCPGTTYDGSPHTATVTSITGVNGETGATVGTVDVSNTTHTAAGTYASDTWTFTGTANYNNIAATTISDCIAKANATVVITPYTCPSTTYTGLSHTATYTITGVNGETGATVGTVDVSNTTHTAAGTYATDTWAFTGTANYNNIATTTITDCIAKANATVVVTPYTCPATIYDGLSHTAAITSITGVNGETGATVGTIDVSNTTHIMAGTYSSDSWSFTGTANYNNIAATTITDCINKKDATWVTNPASKIYGAADPSPLTTGSGSGFAGTEATLVTATYSRVAGENASPPTYHITATLGPADVLANYNITSTGAEFTINQAPLDITASSQTKTYGNTFTFTGTEFTAGAGQLKFSDNVTSATLSSTGSEATATVTAPGPNYAITIGSAVFAPAGAAGNYIITYHSGTLHIDPAALDITANDQNKDYGNTLTFTGTEFSVGAAQLKNTDSVASVTLTSAGAAATAGVAGSPYVITPSAAAGAGLGNYNISYHDGHLTVHAIALDVTANDQNKDYGDTFTFAGTEFSTGSGQLKNTDSVASVTLTSAGAAATAGVAGSPYAITASAATGTGLSNYNISYHDGHLTVHAIALDITANDQSKNYGDAFTFAGTEFGTGAGQLKNTDTVASVTLSSAGAAATAGVAGSPYAIVASAATGTGLGNYNISYHDGHLTVHAIALDITANDQSKNYGDTFTFIGTEFTAGAGQLKNTDSVASVTLTSAGAAATAGVAGSPYAITPSVATGTGLGNYNIAYHDGHLTVHAIALDITANDQNKDYGNAFTFTGTEFATGAGQLKNTDNVASVTLTSAGAAATAGVAGSPYLITASAATGTGLSNYNISYHNGHLTVHAIALDVTANDQSKNYGDAFTFTGTEFSTGAGQLKNSDSVANVTLTSAGAAATAGVAGSPYLITASAATGTGLGNYNISYHDGHLTVHAIALDITANDQNKNYGNTVTFTGTEFSTGAGQLKNTDSVASVTLTSAGAAATAGVAGSPYVITPSAATGTGLGNYNISYHDGHLTVHAIALDITANDQSKDYGDTFTFTGTEFSTGSGQLKNTDSVASVTLTSTGAAATAGVTGSPYAITASAAAGTGLGNYNIAYHDGHLTVHAIALDVTATDESKNYGDTFTPNGATQFSSGPMQLKNGDTVASVTLSSSGYTATAAVAGSPYTITPSAAAGTGLGNYNISYHDGHLTVHAIALDITANDQSKDYGNTFTFTGTEFSTGAGQLKNTDTVASVTLTSGGAAATAGVAGSPYVITASAATGAGLGNYNISYHDGHLTVHAIALDITANDQTKDYGNAFTFTGTEFSTGAGQLKNTDSVASVTLTSAGAAATAGVAGSPYAITPSVATGTGLGNYNITYHDGHLTVHAIALDVTATDESKDYGDTFTPNGTTQFSTGPMQLKNGDTVASVTLSSSGYTASAAVAGSPYAITPSAATGTGLGNYNISYRDGHLTVHAIALDITANDQSKDYGGTFTFTGTEFSTGSGQLKNTDSVASVTLTSAGAAATAAVAGSPYAIVASAATGTGLGNYNITYHDGHLTVHAIALDITATDQSKNYGDTFTFTGSEFTVGMGQLKNTDSVTSVTLTSAGAAATAGVTGSPYAITPSAAVGSGLSNYNISYHDASIGLTVHAISLDITANNQSKNYGDTFTFTGTEFTVGTGQLKNTDSVTSVTLTSAGAAATATVAGSPYTITPSAATGTGLSNYNISYNDASVGLTVNAIALDITANNQSKNYSDTFTFTGSEFTVGAGQLKNTDSVASVTLTSAGAAGTATVAGSPYAIVAGNATGTGLGNYNISYHDGHLTVNAIALDITANNQSKNYGNTFTFTGSEFTVGVGQLKNTDNVASVTLTSAGAAGTATVAGSPYAIVASNAVGSGLSNYNISYHDGHLTVNAIALDITANNQSKNYGITFTFTGMEFTTGAGQLKNGDAVASVSLSSAGAPATATVAGSPYSITASSAIFSPAGAVTNYNITYHSGLFTVNTATLTITATNRTKTYGVTYTPDTTPASVDFNVSGLVNTDSVTSITLVSSGYPASATFTAPGPDYTVTPGAAVGTGLGNYTIGYVNGSLHVNQATLTITATNRSKVFAAIYTPDTTFPSVDFNVVGLVNTDTVTSIALTCAGYAAAALPQPTPYTVTPGAAVGTGLGNYTIGYVNGQFTIGYGTCTGSDPGGVILPPINSDGSSVYKRKGGSTIPVKFTVCDANGNPISNPQAVFAGTGGQLTMLSHLRGTVNNVNEDATNDIPDVAFTYTGGQWHFNMDTANLDAPATYTFRINLADGSGITFVIGTK